MGEKYLCTSASVLALVELARDEQHRVVGLIVAPVERLKPLDRNVLDVGARADRASCRSCATDTPPPPSAA